MADIGTCTLSYSEWVLLSTSHIAENIALTIQEKAISGLYNIDAIITESTGSTLIGAADGDFIRFDFALNKWKVVSEPIALTEIRLVPKAASTGAEGTIFYCSTDNQIYVGTE
jgi:hypothetical protein